MNRKDALTLAAVAVFLAVCPALRYFRGNEHPLFHVIHSILIAAIILNIIGWKIELPKNRPGFLGSVFFILGAMFLATITYIMFYAIVGLISFAPIPLEPGGVPIYEKWGLWGTIRFLLIAPIAEEIIFRLGLMNALIRLTNKPFLALILSSVIFAEGHFAGYPQSFMPALFLIGLALGLTFQVLGLPWAIILHFIFNSRDILVERIVGQTWLLLSFYSVLMIGVFVFMVRLFHSRKAVFGKETP